MRFNNITNATTALEELTQAATDPNRNVAIFGAEVEALCLHLYKVGIDQAQKELDKAIANNESPEVIATLEADLERIRTSAALQQL